MANPDLIMTLGKVIVATAWADGNVTIDEVNSLKDLLFRLPEMNATRWAELEMYIDSPVGPDERDRLVSELVDRVRSQSDRELAISALHAVISADGDISAQERAVFEEVRTDLETKDVGLGGALKRLFSGPIQRHAADAPNRERLFDEFIRNRVYFAVQQRLQRENGQLEIPDDKLRKLSLAAGVMARVARVDKHIDVREVDVIVRALQEGWHINEEEATFVAMAATSDEAANLDPFRTAREFFEICTQDELVAFAKVLFRVAAADGRVSQDETDEIRTIANTLLLSQKQFIEAKTSVPRELRAD
ncbi:MAG: TerB family tellurite resistance protein [Chloroflexota bacterium]